jgi:C-terminal processing protease CtpA/Prc
MGIRRWVFMFIATVALGPAASASEAGAAYDRIQSLRGEARALWTPESASEADLRRAGELLREALALRESPAIDALSEGNIYLRFRRFDVLRDLAATHAKLGETSRALELLEEMQRMAWSPGIRPWLADAPEFSSLRAEPRFQAVLATLDAAARLYERPALATPYRETLPLAERIAGLSLFWSTAREHFAYFDAVPDLDWDKTYLEFLPRVIAAESTLDYYRVLMQLAPVLRDGHTNIYPPEELSSALVARPPIRTERIDGRVVITAVRSPRLARQVRVGEVIVAIDGEPVDVYAAREVLPFVSASTPQDRDVRLYGYQLLTGPADQPVALRLEDARGRVREVSVARSGHDDVRYPERFQLTRLPQGIVALGLEQFEDDAGPKAFERAWPTIREARGLVLDLRDNGGGSTSNGFEILAWLTDRSMPVARQWTRTADSLRLARFGGRVDWRREHDGSPETFVRERKERYSGPVVVLIGPRTFSAAEDFVVAFDVLDRGLLVGERTAGSTGQPMMLKLPGGGFARVCVKRDEYPDGRPFVGVGIAPDVQVRPTLSDARAGRDAAMERAIALLRDAAAGR